MLFIPSRLILTPLILVALPLLSLPAWAEEPAEVPLTAFPYTPGLDLAAMDKTSDPCVDFYQYTCGGWITHNPIPADQAKWSVYGKLSADNQRFLWGILANLGPNTPGRSATQQKIGDYFAACMDEPALEKAGIAPLQPYFDAVSSMKTKQDLPRVLGDLSMTVGEDGFFFDFGSTQDYSDSSQVIASASAGGLGLPDRDYYLKNDAPAKAKRQEYATHIANMLVLLGDQVDAAKKAATTIIAIETELAQASLSRVDKRDPYKIAHKMGLKGLQALTPEFDWTVFLHAIGVDHVATVNVSEPAFFRRLAKVWTNRSLDELKTYLRWHLVSAEAPQLVKALVDENFAFFERTLHGVQVLKPRWKRCVAMVDNQLGEALGQEYVARAFGPELKASTVRMTLEIEEQMKKDIDALTWMSPATKRKAQEKLHAIANKIGYPGRWRDYGSYEVKKDDFFGNFARGNAFYGKRQLAKIGKPLDRNEWSMTPPTVNAYYDAQMNDINFPAGILQPPLYDPKMDDAPNYGNTGGTIGHELTHGFDDEGRQFDAKGNLREWWTKKDAKAFNERTQCVMDQYAQYKIVDDIKINSKLTVGEDVADLGGLILSWMAWQAHRAKEPAALRDGFTPEQRFFIGYAQWACEADRPENLRVKAVTDPHSPGKYRVNGIVVNMPEFTQAFACKAGQPMAGAKRCRVW